MLLVSEPVNSALCTMYATHRRVKRDSPDNLYRQCAITGNCPPDVKNKIEGTTLADRLLKIFGSILYLGGLGIGTGRGSGGSFGYRPVAPSTPRVVPEGSVIRPTPPIDPLGPVDLIPVDAVDPLGSSIVPLSEGGGLPESGVIEEVPVIEATVPSVISESDPISDIVPVEGHPNVTAPEDGAAVLDVQPAAPPPKRAVVEGRIRPSHPQHISVLSSSTGSSADINVFVDAHFGGDIIGGVYEEIPLEPLPRRYEFEIVEGGTQPKTSTPTGGGRALVQRARDLYNRRVQQIRTRNVDFLGRPSRLVQFEFDNPAFQDDVTLTFEQDLQDITAAPEPDFTDIIQLQRPRMQEYEGHVRVSRLGRRGTIRTRSGLQIGQQVHFYYDLSTIEGADAIELSVLGEHTGESEVVHGLAESTFVDSIAETDVELEAALFDEQVEDFSNSHLVLSSSSRGASVSVPTIPPGIALKVFVDDVGSGLFVSYPAIHVPSDTSFSETPLSPALPALVVDPFSDGFYLHPSLERRKRKRRYSDAF
ncbi:L2 protein [Human papillomavirus type 220]|uniref:Minor capsid protein L2 n=1 Tax=Human papillomavirus type 220 TaxID=2200957 RepID=A0A2S1ZRW6_9PAPI|nr:L2 protein [Human papillomavirus type 220]